MLTSYLQAESWIRLTSFQPIRNLLWDKYTQLGWWKFKFYVKCHRTELNSHFVCMSGILLCFFFFENIKLGAFKILMPIFTFWGYNGAWHITYDNHEASIKRYGTQRKIWVEKLILFSNIFVYFVSIPLKRLKQFNLSWSRGFKNFTYWNYLYYRRLGFIM